MKKRVVIVGASGHASVILESVELSLSYQIVGLIDSFKPIGSRCAGYEVIGRLDTVEQLASRSLVDGFIVGIGDNVIRRTVQRAVLTVCPALEPINAIHPSAILSPRVRMGRGVAVMAGAVINCNTTLGDGCFVNTNASLDHDNTLGEYCCVQPGACTGGNVAIGELSMVGLGAIIIQGITIGRNSVIGAGSTVLIDIPHDVIAYGSPCRVARPNEIRDDDRRVT